MVHRFSAHNFTTKFQIIFIHFHNNLISEADNNGTNSQDRNEVGGIREQRGQGSGIRGVGSGIRGVGSGIRRVGSGIRRVGSGIRRVGSGVTALGSGMTSLRIRISSFLGIRLYHFCGISNQNLSCFWNQASEIWVQKGDQQMKSHTSL